DNSGAAIASDWTLTATGPTGFSGAGPSVGNGVSFDAGVYNLSESGPAGYSASAWVCVGGTQNDNDTITLGLGESATCTITNDDTNAFLTLEKVVINDNGAAAVDTDWTLSASGPTNISGVEGDASITNAGVDAGIYSLSENGPADYTQTDLSCSGAADTDLTDGLTITVGEDVTCTFTNDDDVIPLIVSLINSNPATPGDSIIENESILDTLGITQIMVEFNKDVYNPPLDTIADDVTNPANYKLVRSSTGTFATVDCAGGVLAPDISISVDSVTYDNGGGSGPFIATLSINGGFPLNVVGFYRLYVCGTTSIVDAANTGLILAGDGLTPGTDFQRNFRIATAVAAGGGGGGGGRGGNTATSQTQVTSGFLLPVIGFAPHQTTTLPAQPADKAYKPMGEMTIEIPTLGINFPIVGASITNKTWDLTWLQNSVAYLEGSAYPTLAGNTVLTAHVLDAANNIGPFSDIKGMQVGQMVYIHANGQTYVYQVQESQKILPTSIAKIFKHEEDSWVTLVTCEDYNAKTGLYTTRRMVRAVLISVIPDKK
ncbi:partial Sortase A, partial [Anaerolineae bacterium]